MSENKNIFKIIKPKINDKLLELDLLEEGISDYDSISTVLVNDSLLENIDAKGVSFNEVVFRNVIKAVTKFCKENRKSVNKARREYRKYS